MTAYFWLKLYTKLARKAAWQLKVKKVKFSHTRYRALGPELIPVYRQSARRPQVTWSESRHSRLPLLSARPAVTSVAFTRWRYLLTAAHIWFKLTTQFIDPERMKGWVGLVGWPIADGLPTLVVTHQLQVEQEKFAGQRPTFYHCATPPTLTTRESKGRFFYKTNRFESIRITNRIDSNRELECSTACRGPDLQKSFIFGKQLWQDHRYFPIHVYTQRS